MSNSPTGRSAEPISNSEKPNLGMFVPGTGIPAFGGYVHGPDLPAAAMIPLFGERILPRAIPRSAYMDARDFAPPESYFTLADRFIAPFVHISLRAINALVPVIDRRLNARQRRRIRRMMQREMNKAAAHALMYGRP